MTYTRVAFRAIYILTFFVLLAAALFFTFYIYDREFIGADDKSFAIGIGSYAFRMHSARVGDEHDDLMISAAREERFTSLRSLSRRFTSHEGTLVWRH